MKENPFSHKSVEKVLFSIYMPHAEDKRRTRKYLRKMARHIEHGFEIGCRDGAAGKPLISLEDLQRPDDSPMKRDIIRQAYAAYWSGYQTKGGVRVECI